MEASLLAKLILSSENLEDKLFTPEIITDLNPGSPIFWDTPARAPEMLFTRRDKKEKLLPFIGYHPWHHAHRSHY